MLELFIEFAYVVLVLNDAQQLLPLSVVHLSLR